MATKKKALQAAAGAAGAGAATYVDDVFSTYLYTGNGSTQTITNGIDLAGEGGLVWVKCRSIARNNILGDSERIGTNGGTRRLISNLTAAQSSTSFTTFFLNSSGFQTNGGDQDYNGSGETYVSWTFRKAPGFFDVVTWTGDGSGDRNISHNLESVPGCIITKATSAFGTNWHVFHRSINAGRYGVGYLNATNAFVTGTSYDWNPTATTFLASAALSNNDNGTTYVAYLFADGDDAAAQIFGTDGDQAVVKCGSYTGTNNTAHEIDVGFEPQWLLIKGTDRACDWIIADVMRGASAAPSTARLEANTSDAEAISTSGSSLVHPTATGFNIPSGVSGQVNEYNENYIYIAIRRPHKPAESGTEVFDPNYTTSNQFVTTGFPVDLQIGQYTGGGDAYWVDRLRGMSTSTTGSMQYLRSTSTNAEASNTGSLGFNGFVQNGFSHTLGNFGQRLWSFKRAPGFFDVVCFYATAGTAGSPTQTFNHNLGVIPELAISKTRDQANSWFVYSAALGTTKRLRLQSDGAEQTTPYFTALTSSTFTIDNYNTGTPAANNVAYLFASQDGISKVGSYTGNGTSQNIDCGFSAGARFVLIKRTDTTGDWHVWDTARGIVAGNDPFLELNTTNAENSSYDSVDPYSAGFTVNEDAGTAINTSGGSYIFLAIS